MPKLIVNLTTTRNRLPLCAHAVFAIARQKRSPDEICVWVSRDPYLMDEGIDDEPDWVEQLRRIGPKITFRWTKNTGPFRKIFPALEQADESDILVYADDDVAYGENWLQILHEEFSQADGRAIVATRVRRLAKNTLGFRRSYLDSPLIREPMTLNTDYIITGIGGAMLHRRHIAEDLARKTDFLALCPRNDDPWISKLIQLTGTPVRTAPRAMPELHEITHNSGLWTTNLRLFGERFGLKSIPNRLKTAVLKNLGFPICQNDIWIRNVDRYFRENPWRRPGMT